MTSINIKATYIVNHAYKFRSDVKRIMLINNNSFFCDNYDKSGSYSTSFSSKLHPLTAYIFSFFDGTRTLEQVSVELNNLIDVGSEVIISTLSQFIHNIEPMLFPLSQGYLTLLPKNFLIENRNGQKRDLLEGINLDLILEEGLDFTTMRHYIPDEICLMLNNRCVVDCKYCYADTLHHVDNPMSFCRVEELISEASSLGCRDFVVGGGEFFLYKDWEKLIIALHQHEYEPFISTKFPINENTVKKIKELNIKKLQVSLDTINPIENKIILNVDDSYLNRIKTTLKLLNDYKIPFRVKSVITKYNDSIESVERLVDYLLKFNSLTELSIAPGESSMNKPFEYSSTPNQLKIIEDYINTIRLKDSRVEMLGYLKPSNLSPENKMKEYNNRPLCTGNVTSFYALPDGKVTICEQTYWHPFFILGDLSVQSIMEVWNSKKALSLWNISQDEIQDASPCKLCEIFEECRRGKGNCWRLAVQAYGNDKYDFPDPKCPYAPPVTQPFYIE